MATKDYTKRIDTSLNPLSSPVRKQINKCFPIMQNSNVNKKELYHFLKYFNEKNLKPSVKQI